MPLVRILIDGYSLLHAWPGLAPGKARHSEDARNALLRRLEEYQPARGVPVTVFFDGQGAPPGTPRAGSRRDLEVLFSPRGRTADDLIERVVHRLLPYGEVLVVTDDGAERDTVLALGGLVSGTAVFIDELEGVHTGLRQDLRRHNQRERDRFRRQS